VSESSSERLLIVDGHHYAYRSFYAIRSMNAPDGFPTNAIFGFIKTLNRMRDRVQPTHIAVIWDGGLDEERTEALEEYKADRDPMPDDMAVQLDAIIEWLEAAGICTWCEDGVEADDVIGTLAKAGEEAGWNVVISTGDKDMAQLVSERITLVNTMKNETLDIEGVKHKFGVRPDQIIDYLALMGDKVDNVPGVEKCGPKTAVKWLESYDTLQGVMAHADEIKGKVGENLQAALPRLPLSYELVTIKTDVDLHGELPEGLHSLHRQSPKWSQLAVEFKRLNFRTWLKEAETRISEGSGEDLFATLDIG
jgi:DNA polymerase-1